MDQDTPMQEERELRAIEVAAVHFDLAVEDDTAAEASHDPMDEHERPRRSRSRSEDLIHGRVLAAMPVATPYGVEVDEVCGVCLENHGPETMVALWCCRNLLCIYDARKIGACPFCREEPLMWNIRQTAPLPVEAGDKQ